MPDSDTVTLQAGGRRYGGWTALRISRSIETIAGGFELELTERWTGQAERWPIRPGDSCTVAIGGDVVITGWVDDVDVEISGTAHALRVAGRDRTGDLVDCSAVHAPDQWDGLTLDRLARTIAQPFGVKVRAETDLGAPFQPFKIQPGETAFEAIERACRLRAVLPVSDGRGGLVLTRAGLGRAAEALVEGENIVAAAGRYSWRERFSEYTVKAQRTAVDDDDVAGAAHVAGAAKDAGVGRYRPLLVLAEGQADGIAARDRAAWEAAVRAGRSTRAEISVQGWRQRDGSLWPLNGLVPVRSAALDIDARLLIVGVTCTLSEAEGSRTVLSLARPDAYRLIPEVSKGQGAHGLPPGTEMIESVEQLRSFGQ